MAKEILLYGGVSDYSAERFITQVESAKLEPISLRVNSNGGDPQSSFGMIAKFNDHKNGTLVKIDGKAHSTALYFAIAADNVEALNVSTGILHRAAYPKWVESNKELMTEARVSELNRINSFLRNIVESKVNVEKLEAISSVTLDELFSLDSRIDVSLDAFQMEEIGIVDKIVSITPDIEASINSCIDIAIAAEYGERNNVQAKEEKITKINNKMTIEKLRTDHPEIYAQVVKVGVNQEKDRVEAILAYSDIDMVACKAAVESGDNMSQKFIAEMTVKGMKAVASQETEETAPEDVQETTEEAKTEEESNLESFTANVQSQFKSE